MEPQSDTGCEIDTRGVHHSHGAREQEEADNIGQYKHRETPAAAQTTRAVDEEFLGFHYIKLEPAF